MSARELHDHIAEYGLLVAITHYKGDDTETILRALDLLARVEESEDELVRKLHNLGLPDPHDERDHPARQIVRDAAAALVALKAERDGLLRGEYICRSCGLRKNGEIDATPSF